MLSEDAKEPDNKSWQEYPLNSDIFEIQTGQLHLKPTCIGEKHELN